MSTAEFDSDLQVEIDGASEEADMRLSFILDKGGDPLTAEEQKAHAGAILIASAIFSLTKKLHSIEDRLHSIAMNMPESS